MQHAMQNASGGGNTDVCLQQDTRGKIAALPCDLGCAIRGRAPTAMLGYPQAHGPQRYLRLAARTPVQSARVLSPKPATTPLSDQGQCHDRYQSSKPATSATPLRSKSWDRTLEAMPHARATTTGIHPAAAERERPRASDRYLPDAARGPHPCFALDCIDIDAFGPRLDCRHRALDEQSVQVAKISARHGMQR